MRYTIEVFGKIMKRYIEQEKMEKPNVSVLLPY